MQEKWRGVLHHVQDVHEWYMGECDHSALTEPHTNQQGAVMESFRSGDADFSLFRSIIVDQRWMKSLKYYANFRYRCLKVLITVDIILHNFIMPRHIGMLESFHNTLLAYCPKRCAFG